MNTPTDIVSPCHHDNTIVKPALMFLSHRIPYPPDKGDKIRSYHFLRGLAAHYRIFLGAYVDEEDDWQHASTLESLCEEVYLVKLSHGRKITRALIGLASGRSLTTSCYRDSQMDNWASRTMAEQNIARVLAFSGGVGPIALKIGQQNTHRIIDLVDVDSEKWRQYASSRYWPMSMVFRREARRLLHEERVMGSKVDAVLFVSRSEANLFAGLAPELANRITFVPNGVDTDYFTPDAVLSNPYDGHDKSVIFTGAMDYWPNVDAVTFFSKEVMPRLLARDPCWRFYIVGSRPDKQVLALDNGDSTRVIGTVKDMRPWLRYATIAVAPMRVARGIQNKVLEAMAMELPVIASQAALEGIGADVDDGVVVADTPQEYIEAITKFVSTTEQSGGARARKFVARKFSWNTSASRLADLIETIRTV